MSLLEIRNLIVEFPTSRGPFRAVDGLDLTIEPGKTLGIVGESGSGKSITMLAAMGLVPWPGQVRADQLSFNNMNLLGISAAKRRSLLGKDVAMIFQEPTTSLNPCFTIGYQIMETLAIHQGGNKRQRYGKTLELLEKVGISAAAKRMDSYPHQLSGGMNQRVMIAMAIACNPRLLIADEPTTALDVTIQAQILDLLRNLQKETGMSLILITHDMGVVAEMAENIMVMYAGQVVEKQSANQLFKNPQHPYTAALLQALPERSKEGEALLSIPGTVPGIYDRLKGCLFHPRCQFCQTKCRQDLPALEANANGRSVRCHYPLGSSIHD
ncbi:MAG: ABC transporter ATP-binding protein [Rhodospirillaceae bacterium]|nr:ABC transporter ATP-binding protein [Rhodospirillaceae bacterium]